MFQASRLRPRAGGRVLFGAAALTLWATLSWADSHVQPDAVYSLSWHTISTGGNTLRNGCFVLRTSIGQIAPGFSSNDMYQLHAGFLASVPGLQGRDQLFFDAFEDCTP